MGYSIDLLRNVGLGLAIILASGTCTQISSQDLTQNDIKAIEHQYASYAEAVLNGDAESAVATYADQAVEIYPNRVSNVGKPNILNRYNRLLTEYDFTRFIMNAEWIEGTGSLAVVMGKHAFTNVNRENEQTDQFHGYHTQIFRKQADGAWKTLAIYYINIPIDQPIPTKIPDADRQHIGKLINGFEIKPTEYEPKETGRKFANLFSGQGVIIWPTQRSLVGKPNIKVAYSNSNIVELKMSTLGMSGVGEMAVAYGEKKEKYDPADGGELITFNGPWAMIFAKIPDEGWKILVVHWTA